MSNRNDDTSDLNEMKELSLITPSKQHYDAFNVDDGSTDRAQATLEMLNLMNKHDL